MNTETLILAVLASSGLWKFLEFLIGKIPTKKKKKTKIEELSEKMDDFIKRSDDADVEIEKSLLRTQMMQLMYHTPEDEYQILTMAKRYFVDLKGDWYFTSIFKQYCVKNNVPFPEWFRGDE